MKATPSEGGSADKSVDADRDGLLWLFCPKEAIDANAKIAIKVRDLIKLLFTVTTFLFLKDPEFDATLLRCCRSDGWLALVGP